jgi:NADH-quinone oxidoreductase subunit B
VTGRTVLDWGTTYRVHVLDLGLACCGVEVMAALHDGSRLPAQPGGSRLPAQLGGSRLPAQPGGGEGGSGGTVAVLVVSGTVTDVLLPAVLAAYDELPEPRYVVSVGACCGTGGPYWDSYSVTKGIDQVLPVHVTVPGCPPRPEAVRDGLAALHRMLSGVEAGA